MNITGKFTIFVQEVIHHSNKPSSKNFFTAIGKKLDNDKYINFFIDVVFSKDIMTDGVRAGMISGNAYSLEVEKGFLTPDVYEDKDGKEVKKLVLVVQEGKLELKSRSK